MKLLFLVTFISSYYHVLAYKAAVVEYYPSTEATPHETILKNIDEYRQLANNAKQEAVDIIVFPEYGLTTLVQDPEEYAIEINTTNDVITKLSILAKERGMYLVVNLIEKETKDNNVKYYNTNLVFDRNGTIIAKYRKINLYSEPKLTPGLDNQSLTFSTDFGVTFGIFTCFDIFFKNPSRKVLENSDVTSVVFPTAWMSVLPFYHSLSVQQGYAMANGVTLLAANFAKPKDGRGGSGIYLTDGKILETYIGDTPSTKLIVREITQNTKKDTKSCSFLAPQGLPGDSSKSNISDFMTKKEFSASNYAIQNVDLSLSNFSTTVCHREICCTFDIKVDLDSPTSEIYKVMAYDGLVTYDTTQTHIRLCSLVICENDSNDSCGARFENTSTRFTKIEVKGNLPYDDTTIYAPITLNTYLLPMQQTGFCDTGNATYTTFVKLTTLKAQQNVLVFGLYGRTDASVLTDPDEHDDGKDSAVQAYGLSLLLIMAAIKCVIF